MAGPWSVLAATTCPAWNARRRDERQTPFGLTDPDDNAPTDAGVVAESDGDDELNYICAMPCRHRLTLQHATPYVLPQSDTPHRPECWSSPRPPCSGPPQLCDRQ